MNERIKELAEQSGASISTTFGEYAVVFGEREAFEKFAELIVQECMDAVGDGPLERPAIQRIKAKFGVEYYELIEKAFGVEE